MKQYTNAAGDIDFEGLIEDATPAPPGRKLVRIGRTPDEEWDLADLPVRSTNETEEVIEVQGMLSQALTEASGETIVVLGEGRYQGRRVPLCCMAASPDGQLVAVALIEANSDLRLCGDAELPPDGEEPGFTNGYWMAYFEVPAVAVPLVAPANSQAAEAA